MLWVIFFSLASAGQGISIKPENGDAIALCGNRTVLADVVTFDYVESEVKTNLHDCSCDVTAADGGVVSMAINVSIKYTSSCPGLRLKFNDSAPQPVQCRSGQGVQLASYSLPALALASFRLRLRRDARPRPLAMTVTIRGAAGLVGMCGNSPSSIHHSATQEVTRSRPTTTTTTTTTTAYVQTTSDVRPPSPVTTTRSAASVLTSQGISGNTSCHGNQSQQGPLGAAEHQDDEKTARVVLAVVLTSGVVIVAVVVTFVYLKRTNKLYLCLRNESSPASKPHRVTTLRDVMYAAHKGSESVHKATHDVDSNFILKTDRDSGVFVTAAGESMDNVMGVFLETTPSRRSPREHTMTSQAALHSEGHTTTSRAALQSEGHTMTSQAALQSEGHTMTSQVSLQNEGHTMTSRAALQSEGHTMTSRAALQSEGQTMTPRAALQSEGHTKTSRTEQPMADKGYNEVKSVTFSVADDVHRVSRRSTERGFAAKPVEQQSQHYHSVDIIHRQAQAADRFPGNDPDPGPLISSRRATLEYDKLRRGPDPALASAAHSYNHIPCAGTDQEKREAASQATRSFGPNGDSVSVAVSHVSSSTKAKGRTVSGKSHLGRVSQRRDQDAVDRREVNGSHVSEQGSNSLAEGGHSQSPSPAVTETAGTTTTRESPVPPVPPPPEAAKDSGSDSEWHDRVLHSQILIFTGHYSIPRLEDTHVTSDVTEKQATPPRSIVTTV